MENIDGIEFFQNEITRRPNGLIFKMRQLFNMGEVTTWEYGEFKRLVRAFAEKNKLYFDESSEMIYCQRKI